MKKCKFDVSCTTVSSLSFCLGLIRPTGGTLPPPNLSRHVSHRIYANLRTESGDGWGGGSCPNLPLATYATAGNFTDDNKQHCGSVDYYQTVILW